jgi:predicted RecB family nuclease
MQKRGNDVLYSASDLANYLECEHLTALDLMHLDTPLAKTADSDEAKLLQAKGYAHEAAFLAVLASRHATVIDISKSAASFEQQVHATHAAMADGVDIIFQATLQDGPLVGYADFLRKVPRPSKLGGWSYEVLDTKLARTTQAKFLIQLGFYSALVAKVQGVSPLHMHVVLGDGTEAAYRCADYARYLDGVTQRFLARVDGNGLATYPLPCDKCDLCKWRELCAAKRSEDDHLSQVANITKTQIKKLETVGITTLKALAVTSPDTPLKAMAPATFATLHEQARLQWRARETGQNQLQLLTNEGEVPRGLARLPRPADGDLFFDMEGNPFESGGLEYLFGLYYFVDGQPQFKAFWAHSRREEKVAFEAFMDLVTTWLARHPGAHIYHYAHYEQTALKKLMSLHGTREAAVDGLLRAQKFIDLYQVVREGMRVSEPRYSIKNIEHFYLQARSGDVKSAGASIVYYERWKDTGEAQLLKDIEAYNFDDVRSTFELRRWLLSLRPANLAWANASHADAGQTGAGAPALSEDELALIPFREALVDRLPVERSTWDARAHLHELTYQLLDFHRRAAKPEWWAMFERMDMDESSLLEDVECLAGLMPDPAHPPLQHKRSIIYTFLYEPQESKRKTGDGASITLTGEPVNDLTVDEDARRVTFKRSAGKAPLPVALSLGPGMPVSTKALRGALFRFGGSIVNGSGRYAALEGILNQTLPQMRGRVAGAPVVRAGREALPEIIDAIASLDGSCLFVQGPPGAGKTYTGSHVIVALLQMGYRVGVSSNSHHAINNLLRAVEKIAHGKGFAFRGAKKSTLGKPESCIDGACITDVFANANIIDQFGLVSEYQLVAGTAWLFADADMDQKLDFLFVDEAGQVALANLVAMGTSAKNIVLLGDQMQLGQPIQGVHPGRSGESSLEFLLNGLATMPPERGIFLGTTWRMHPDVCRFISDAVYDGRLLPAPDNSNQRLLLDANAHPALRQTGIRYVPAMHDTCTQRSREEADLVCALVASLLLQRYCDKTGTDHAMTLEDILVVAPYNMQVNLLKAVLPEGARVGTVDKFQGQEAQVVIMSMATSSGEYSPRNIGFLYSKNRLNVSISRAKCLAIFIASPALMAIRCTTPEEMALVNTLCWVQEVGVQGSAARKMGVID